MTNRKGFTLIELLVVIAIIAILAAILFPVFARARAESYKTACQSNLKNFALAFQMYVQDWDALPLPMDGGQSQVGVWMDSADTSGVTSPQIGAIWPYVQSRLTPTDNMCVWSCPAAPHLPQSATNPGYSVGDSYAMNEYLRKAFQGEINFNSGRPAGYYCGLSPDSCSEPSKVILLFEAVQDIYCATSRAGSPWYWAVTSNPVNNQFATRFPNGGTGVVGMPNDLHMGMCSFLFLDGHVKCMMPAQTWTQASSVQHSGTTTGWMYFHLFYPGTGPDDLWNPQAPGVTFP
jgi:prepilin-type N-terminal cleavage/methylation domain-containing protein/prepilin-type processing-associated H-X9-DG protein